jgi:hypothetical protein
MYIRRLDKFDHVAMRMLAICGNTRTEDLLATGITWNRIDNYARSGIITRVGYQQRRKQSMDQAWALTNKGRRFIFEEYSLESSSSLNSIQHNITVAAMYANILKKTNSESICFMGEPQLREVVEDRLQILKEKDYHLYLGWQDAYQSGEMSMPDVTYVSDNDKWSCIEVVTKKYTEEQIDAKKRTAIFFGAELDIVKLPPTKKTATSRIVTSKQKDELIKENSILLGIIYWFGSGIMLRQQLVHLTTKITNKPQVEVQLALSDLKKKGIISSQRFFLGCNNRIIALSRYAIAQFNKGSSCDCWVPSLSTQNKLYYLFRTEYFMQYERLTGMPLNHPVFARKNQTYGLYGWFAGIFPTTFSFQDDFDAVKGKLTPCKFLGMKKSETFNFSMLLSNNILIEHGICTGEVGEIHFAILDINRMSIEKLKELIHCVTAMVSRYTDINFNSIAFTVYFFNQNEKQTLSRKWERVRLDEHLMSKGVYLKVANACEVNLHSFDFDLKYHLHRDIDL